MASDIAERRQKTPRYWHTWVIAAFMLAMYLGGVRDYLLVLIGDVDYIRNQFGPAGVSYFAEYPFVYRVLWTLNIVGGLIAPILLVLRQRWALHAAGVSLASQVMLLLLTFTFRDRWDALGPMIAAFDIVITLVTAVFAYYCWRLQRHIPRRGPE